MFIILLKFSINKDKAAQYMEGHNAWLKKGFDEDIFLLAGSLKPKLGGVVIAANESLDGMLARVNQDPFVIQNVVNAEVLEVSPAKANEQLGFLL